MMMRYFCVLREDDNWRGSVRMEYLKPSSLRRVVNGMVRSSEESISRMASRRLEFINFVKIELLVSR